MGGCERQERGGEEGRKMEGKRRGQGARCPQGGKRGGRERE